MNISLPPLYLVKFVFKFKPFFNVWNEVSSVVATKSVVARKIWIDFYGINEVKFI